MYVCFDTNCWLDDLRAIRGWWVGRQACVGVV